jgi:hypothetical protein
MKLYIAVLTDVNDYMCPTLVAHAMLGAHLHFVKCHTNLSRIVDEGPYVYPQYIDWLQNSFKKVTVRVNQREFDRIAALPYCYLGHENTTLEGRKSCAIPLPYLHAEQIPNVLRFAKLWAPK